MQNKYLCLAIGNSRLHWAFFQEDKLELTWNTQHLSQLVTDLESLQAIFPAELSNLALSSLPFYIASVLPLHTNFCH
mgnify:CR=1 FL=1